MASLRLAAGQSSIMSFLITQEVNLDIHQWEVCSDQG
jgi:hypothetical protein